MQRQTPDDNVALRKAHEEALVAAQQQERRAVEAEAELREARHALRELATQIPVCERLVADLRADSAAGRNGGTQERGAAAELAAMRSERDQALAELERAR